MSFFKKQIAHFYCAFCKTSRKMNMQKHVQAFEISLALLGSVLLMLLFFQTFDPRGIVFFGIFLSIMELIIQLKYRLGLTCTHCGFDPLLYMKSRERACEQVKAHLEARKNDPMTLLTAQPRLNLPVIKVKKDHLGRDKKIVLGSKPTPSHLAKNLDLKM